MLYNKEGGQYMSIMVYVWLGIFIITLAIELAVPALVSIWFTAGSLISFIFALLFGDNAIWLQVILFLVVSGLTIYFLRPIAFKNTVKTNTNVDSLIDAIGACTEDVKKYSIGACKINGLVWSSIIDEEEQEILKGELVKVVEVRGNKLLVKKYIKEEK